MEKIKSELSAFIGDSLRMGIPRERISLTLNQAGWPEDQVNRALSEYAEIDFPLPVPKPKPYLSAREAFFYLLLFTTLYISSINFGNLLFNFIDQAVPDPAAGPYSHQLFTDRIRWSVSALIVAFPVFLYLSRKISIELLSNPAGRASGVRRWLTYITLFNAAGIVIGDLSVLVYNLLGGELTLRFCLKVAVVGGIAGSIFMYYLRGLHEEEQEI